MSPTADVSVKLADRIPNSSQLTDLFDQLKTQMGGVHVPGLPLDDLQRLNAGLNLTLPDASNWHTLIPTDVNDLLANFPSGDSLGKPLGEPLAQIKTVFDHDFLSQFERVKDSLGGIAAPSTDSPEAMFDGLFKPLESISGLIQDTALKELFDLLGQVLGLHELAQLPQTTVGWITEVQTVLRDKVEALVLAFLALGSVGTVTDRTERVVETIAGTFSIDDTNARFQALLAQFGEGATGLAAQLAAVDLTNSEQVSAAQTHLVATAEAFAAFTASLVRDLAFTEASLAVLNTDAISTQFRALAQTASKVDATQLKSVGDSLQAVVKRIETALKMPDDFSIDRYKSLIHTGLVQVNDELTKFDPARIDQALKDAVAAVNAPFKKLEEFKAEVETIVRGAFQTVREAIEKIDLKPLRALVDGALGQLETTLTELDALFSGIRQTIQGALDDLKKVLDGVKTFVLDPNNGLKKKIEDVFQAINQILDEVNLAGVVAEISATLQPITVSLNQVEFSSVIDATVQALDAITGVLNTIAPLLVTDALKQKLSEAADFLRKIDFDAIGKTLTDSFAEILKSVDEEALGAFKAEYQNVITAIDALDPAPALRGVQAEVFDPLIAELEKVQPAVLLKPVQDGYDSAVSELRKFRPADTFAFITTFFDDLLAKFHSISPAKLLEPINQALQEIHDRISHALRIDEALDYLNKARNYLLPLIDKLDLAPFLGQIEAGHAELRAAVASFDPREMTAPIASIIDSIFSSTGITVTESGIVGALDAIAARTVDINARFAAMQMALQRGQGQLDALDVRSMLATLRSRFGEVNSAASAQVGPVSFTAQVTLLDPMAVLSPMLPKIDRVKAAYATAVGQFGGVVAGVAPVSQALGGLLDAFRSLLSPLDLVKEMLLTPLRQLFPGQTFGSARDVLLALVDQLDPTQWLPDVQPLVATIHAKLKGLLDDAVLNPIGETLHTIKGMIDLLSIQSLTDAIDGVFSEVEAVIQQFNPASIVKAVDDAYQRILGLLEKLNPADFIKEIDKIYADDILGVVQAVSPEKLLLPALTELFAKIKGVLVAIDIEVLFKPVLDKLRALDQELGDGLHRTEGSYQAMLAALDAAAGGGSASVSVSVSAGGG